MDENFKHTDIKWRRHAVNRVHGKTTQVPEYQGPRGFQEVKVPRFHDNGTGWW